MPKPDLEKVEDYKGSVDGGGAKFDTGKLRYDLIPPQVIAEDAAVYTVGAQKYADNNWMRGIKYSRLIAAADRHFTAWKRGERRDPETGLEHLSQARWNLGTLLYFEQHPELYKEFDDRVFNVG